MNISIIIPCFNLELYIEKCLQSIVRQIYDKSKYEILIVFDSCTDNSEEVAKSCLKDSGCNYTFFYTNANRAGLARNVGLENAKGKYIYFVDGDDYLIDLLALKKLYDAMEITGCKALYQERFESDVTVKDKDAIWRYFYTREIIGDTRFSDAEVNEDWEFVRALKQKEGYTESVLLNVVLYHYTFPRPGSITAKNRL